MITEKEFVSFGLFAILDFDHIYIVFGRIGFTFPFH